MSDPRVVVSDEQDGVRIRVERVGRILETVMRREFARGEVTVAFVDNATIRNLNLRHLGRDRTTDVLAFPLLPGTPSGTDRLLGEVVVSVEMAARQAPRWGNSVEDEAALYAIHGLLHLLGYDDRDAASRAVMRSRERRYAPRSVVPRRDANRRPRRPGVRTSGSRRPLRGGRVRAGPRLRSR